MSPPIPPRTHPAARGTLPDVAWVLGSRETSTTDVSPDEPTMVTSTRRSFTRRMSFTGDGSFAPS